jgi:hypothetical protein
LTYIRPRGGLAGSATPKRQKPRNDDFEFASAFLVISRLFSAFSAPKCREKPRFAESDRLSPRSGAPLTLRNAIGCVFRIVIHTFKTAARGAIGAPFAKPHGDHRPVKNI